MGKRSKGRQEYGELRDMGLLPSEARRVMQIPNWRDTPWVKAMLVEPARKWKEASRRGTNRAVYENGRVQSYVARGWIKPGLTTKQIDPFCWIREWCDKAHEADPSYVSPWQQRGRSLSKEHRAIRNSQEYRVTPEMRLEGAY